MFYLRQAQLKEWPTQETRIEVMVHVPPRDAKS
jgi:hypothetical protein